MTEFSWPWTCTSTGDGGSGSFTMDVVTFTNMLLNNRNPTTSGVIYWDDTTPLSTIANVTPFNTLTGTVTGLLAPSNPSGDTVRIASGIGLVDGWLYASDANNDFDVSGGAAKATDIIVLRRDRTGQDVRAELVRGGAGGTATVTQNSTTWEIKIAEVLLDGSGNFSALTDTRNFVVSTNGGMVKLGQFTGDNTSSSETFTVPPGFRELVVMGTVRTTGTNQVFWQFNADTANNYNNFTLSIDDTNTLASSYSAATNSGNIFTADSSAIASYGSPFEMKINNYAGATLYKNASVVSFNVDDEASGNVFHRRTETVWKDTSAITSIRFFLSSGNFATGTTMTLYGIQ